MPTKRERLIRGRRTIEGTPADLWQQGRYVESLALDPLQEFLHDDHRTTQDEAAAAVALREKMGLPPWRPDGPDDD